MKLSVIIVNYNVKHFLEQCLCSVIKACKNIEAEILVIDNNSSDGSEIYLTSKFPSVLFTWNKENTGFAKANNIAVSHAKGDYILFLNPDTILSEDCLEKSLIFFQSHPNAGAVGIRMIDGAGNFLKESKRAFPSPFTSFTKLSGLSKLFPHSKFFNRYHLGHLSETNNQEVDVLAGAFMMLPKKVLSEVGSFDELFFMYGEDVDLSYRIQVAGYKNYYFAESSIIHFKGESTKKGGLNYVRMFYNAMSLFVKKHYSGSSAGLFNFFVQAAILIRAIISLAGKFLKFIGLPLIDAAIILLSFWTTKLWWAAYIKKQANYSPNILLIAFPVFTFIFLVAAFFSGLYDRGYKQRQLNRSTYIAALVLFSSYLFVPADFRFSRGILIFGIAEAFVLMSFLRWFFVRKNILIDSTVPNEQRQTVVVANEKDFVIVTRLMQEAHMQERVLGRVSNNGVSGNSLGSLLQLPSLIKTYAIREVIFCEDGLSFKEIIDMIGILPKNIRYKFHASGSSSIVGSNNKDDIGESISIDKKYIIASAVQKRNKRSLDIGTAVLMLLSFPVHLLLQKKRLRFFTNIINTLIGKNSFVGYAALSKHLPVIKKGVLTSTGLPAFLNNLPEESLAVSDEWYAAEYSVYTDIQKIWRGYQYLGA
ncbi:MAG: glycosyltransferase [Ferruginibacter sp.]